MTAEETGEFSFSAAWQLVWRHRLLVTAISLAGAAIAGLIAFNSDPIFRAEVTVTDVKDRGMGNVGGLAGQLGGLASLAGVSLLPGMTGSTQTNAAVLESHHLSEEFIRRNQLVPVLLRGSKKRPTLWLAVKELKEGVLQVTKDQRRGVTTVSMEWTDPATAARWANAYVALANELIRNRALEDSTRNITYLNGQLAKTDSVELRKVIFNIIENETKTLMLANGRAEYAFEIVDPAVPPELKVRPHRLLLTFLGLVLGFAVASAIAAAVDRVSAGRRAPRQAAQFT